MPRRPARRIPGIRFEAQPPLLDEVLPRMDIAAFVGFAARGPVHVPVAVESAVEFEEIFGGDAPLAWDAHRGEAVDSRLAAAVRDFFRNGGRRCWAVRVAERLSVNFLPIPGVLRLSHRDPPQAQDPGGRMTPAFARARADGSWSDGLRVGSAIAPAPVEVLGVQKDADRIAVEATLTSRGDLAPGDLLRLELAANIVAILPVERVDALCGTRRTGAQRVGRRGLRGTGPGACPGGRGGPACLGVGPRRGHQLRRLHRHHRPLPWAPAARG